ncbi:MAG: hypothetical protein ACTSRZ_05700 [Promethearchaeota archaeon]
MNVSNYFIVISSNITENVYSITTIPYGKSGSYPDVLPDPDNRIDHLFLYSENSGAQGSWKKSYLISNSYQVDAAPFAINLTRGWIPNEEINITIEGVQLTPYSITDGIFENTSGWSWGLGRWMGIFTNQTQDINKNITVKLNWNTNITSAIHFDVYYNATIYSIENALVTFDAIYDEKPVWEVNYTYNPTKYPNWNLIKFEYILPFDWANVLNPAVLLAPDGTDISANYTGPSVINEQNIYSVFNSTIAIKGPGNYSLYCNSTNYAYETSTFIHFGEYRWKTNAFMQGDNITVWLGIFNGTHEDSYINSGNATCELYDIEGNKVTSATLNDDNYDRKVSSPKAVVYYEFNKSDIINSSTSYNMQKGEYSLLFKWTNGDEIGFTKHTFYITDYSAQIQNIQVDENTNSNIITAAVSKNATDEISYKYALFAINETTADFKPSAPYINETINQFYSDFKLNITKILINESLFNPGEQVEVNITVKNCHNAIPFNVKLQLSLNQLVNQQWIAYEINTSEQLLDILGSANDTYTYNLTFSLPNNFIGINAPIRLNPMILTITPYIEGINKEPFALNKIFPFINYTESELEGNVLGYQADLPNSAPVIIKSIPRDQSIIPGDTTYLLQIYSDKFVSTNTSIIKTYSSKLLTNFQQINTVDNLVWNKDFTLQGYLLDEFSNAVADQTISLEYWNGTDWNSYYRKDIPNSNILTTDSSGFFSGLFNSTILNKSEPIQIRLNYAGNSSYYSFTYTKIFYPIIYNNQISVSIVNSSDTPAFKIGELNKLTFKIENIGNSTLTNISYNLQIQDINAQLDEHNYLTIKQLLPSEYIIISYTLNVPDSLQDGSYINFTLNVNYTSIESNESVQSNFDFQMKLLDYSLFDNMTQILITLFIAGIAIIWLYSFFYIIKTHKKLQEVPTVEKERSQRRRRYVEVEELSKELKEEKQEEETAKKKKSADIDDLLKEEGLD